MDPDLKQDIEGSLGGSGITADVLADANTASEVCLPETPVPDETQPSHHRDDTEASSGVVDPADIVVEHPPTDSNLSFVAADDGTASSTTHSTAAIKEQTLQLQQVSHDDLRSDGSRWPKSSASSPHSAAGGGETTIDYRDTCPKESTTDPSTGDAAANTPIGGTTPRRTVSSAHSSSPTGSNSSEADSSGGTDGEERSSTEGRHHEQPDKESKEENQGGGGEKDHPNDLPTQLNRIWGASPPDRAEGLAVMRDMLGYRAELDGILSRLVAVKVRRCHLKQPSCWLAEFYCRTGSREAGDSCLRVAECTIHACAK